MNNGNPVPPTLRHYQRLSSLPFGRWLFSRIICWRAPYFATISPRFHDLQTGLCIVSFKETPRSA